jgi:hypothetical protein
VWYYPPGRHVNAKNKRKGRPPAKNAKDRAKGAALQSTYQRMQDSKATFEVVNGDSSGSSRGGTRYDGNDHFTITLSGSSDTAGLTTNQKVGHEFEHIRQVLDGELGFDANSHIAVVHDATDEAKGYQAGFDVESASPGQGTIVNGVAGALNSGGIPNAAQYLHDDVGAYSSLPTVPLNLPNPPPPSVYQVPK